MTVYGVDFTSAPRRAKPIVVAAGGVRASVLEIRALERLPGFEAFERLLRRPGPWVAGFDFPFGLPSELVRDLGWPRAWRRLAEFCAALSRREWRLVLDGYRASRPAGRKYAHRATDLPAGSSSPMKLVNPPVALMFHEGARRLLASGAHLPLLAVGDRARVALEAYPGPLARSIVGRASYKSDDRARQTRARSVRRAQILSAIPVAVSNALRREIIADPSGDSLDAVLCAVQAARAWRRRARGFGLPRNIPSCEGWIAGA